MSSGLLTSGSLFALNAHVYWQWDISVEVVFLLQTLQIFKSFWDSVVRPLAMRRFSQNKMRL